MFDKKKEVYDENGRQSNQMKYNNKFSKLNQSYV